MTKTEKILDNVVLTNLGLIAVAISTIFMHENDVNSMPIIIRRIFSFLQHYTAEFSLLNFGIMLIAGFWSAALGTLLDEHEQERSQKYMLSNDANTKARLELVNLRSKEGA